MGHVGQCSPTSGGWQCLPVGTRRVRADWGQLLALQQEGTWRTPAEAAGAPWKRQGSLLPLSGASTGLSGPGEQLRAGPEGTETQPAQRTRGSAWQLWVGTLGSLGRPGPREGGTDLH